MMYAYDSDMVSNAQETLAWMLDFGTNVYGYTLEEFYNMFLKSNISMRFGRGDVSIVLGHSGSELAHMVIFESDESISFSRAYRGMERSKEYWVGWALAYYQWKSGLSFGMINEFIKIDQIYKMYSKYHEMDIQQFVDVMDERKHEKLGDSSLKRMRAYAMLSQATLAEKTGIPLKTIQHYEQGQKDIRHAKVETVILLARALGCRVEDLLI